MVNLKKQKEKIHIPNMMTKCEESMCEYLTISENSQTASNLQSTILIFNIKFQSKFKFEHIESSNLLAIAQFLQQLEHLSERTLRKLFNLQDKLKVIKQKKSTTLKYNQDFQSNQDRSELKQKSLSIITLATCSMIPLPTKRVKLNDSLSYCIISINQHSYHQNKSPTILINSCNSMIESENIMKTKSFDIKKDDQIYCNDYNNYINTFPNYHLKKQCSYKWKRNMSHVYNQSKSSKSTAVFPLDYQNLVNLFSYKHFSVEVVDYSDLKDKCISFIQNYTLKELLMNEFLSLSPFSPRQGISQSNQYFYINNAINKNRKVNKNKIQEQFKNKPQINDGLNQNQQQSIKFNDNKQIMYNKGYEPLLKNIQYQNIKEITGIQNIEFSQRTISKLINKFILFLKGDYRSLKFYDLDQKLQQETTVLSQSKNLSIKYHGNMQEDSIMISSDQESFESTKFNLFELLDEQDRKENSPTVQFLNKSKELAETNQNSPNISIASLSSSKTGAKDRSTFSQYTDKYANQLNVQAHNESKQNEIDFEQKEQDQYLKNQKTNDNKLKNKNKEKDYQNLIQDEIKFESDFPQQKNEITECTTEKNNSNINQNKQKQTLFNLSKYIMHLILEFLNEEHLVGVNILPGYMPLIQNVLKLMKKKGQRTEHSQTYYYNHSHYNCLFLLLNQNSLMQISKSEELLHIHQFVYETDDIFKPYDLIQINIIKSIISSLISKQFKIICSFIDQCKLSDPQKYSNYQNYMITKLQYFQRVYQGIKTLKKGSLLVRF